MDKIINLKYIKQLNQKYFWNELLNIQYIKFVIN